MAPIEDTLIVLPLADGRVRLRAREFFGPDELVVEVITTAEVAAGARQELRMAGTDRIELVILGPDDKLLAATVQRF